MAVIDVDEMIKKKGALYSSIVSERKANGKIEHRYNGAVNFQSTEHPQFD